MVPSDNSLRFPYLLFDLGSTLIYFDDDWWRIMAQSIRAATAFLRELGYALDEEAFPDIYYHLIEEYYQKRNDKFVEYTSDVVMRDALSRHSYPEPPEQDLRRALKVLYAVMQAHWHREEDAIPTLETLVQRGYHLGIVSNASDDTDVQTLVDNANIRPYFDFVLTSAVAGMRKPAPAIFEKALAYWGAKPGQAAMVGDLVSADVAGANALGMASIWIARRADTPENRADAERFPPKAVIYALAELPDLLDHWTA